VKRDIPAPLGLFDRVPDRIFGPLASPNRRQHWKLLLLLYERFFGPDAPLPPENGHLHGVVTAEIAAFIQNHRDWQAEDDAQSITDPRILANLTLDKLCHAGWLKKDHVGVRDFIDMPPASMKFLELLQRFATLGPPMIAGKVQVIFNTLRQVKLNPGREAAGLHEAADAARELIGVLNATRFRIREMLHAIASFDDTRVIVKAVFEDLIAEIFIRDYHTLRTSDHPLRHRWEIIQIAEELRDTTTVREQLVAAYQRSLHLPFDKAEIAFENDIAQFKRFERIDEYLDRMNDIVEKATRRAFDFIHYRLRSYDRLDELLEQAKAGIAAAAGAGLVIYAGVAPGEPFSAIRLRTARPKAARGERAIIRRHKPSPRELALHALSQTMEINRRVTADEIRLFLAGPLARNSAVTSDELRIGSINDLCVFLTLCRAALVAAVHDGEDARDDPLFVLSRGYRFSMDLSEDGPLTDNEYLIVPRFTVSRTQGAAYA